MRGWSMKLVNTIHLQGSSQRWILSEISQSRILCITRMEQVWEPQCRMKRVFTSESRLLSPGVSINLRAGCFGALEPGSWCFVVLGPLLPGWFLTGKSIVSLQIWDTEAFVLGHARNKKIKIKKTVRASICMGPPCSIRVYHSCQRGRSWFLCAVCWRIQHGQSNLNCVQLRMRVASTTWLMQVHADTIRYV